MHIETDFDNAYLYLLKNGVGTFCRSDGAEITGTIFDFEDEADSPNGIPYLSIQDASGAVEDIYEDDFVRATFPDTGGADDAVR